MDDEIVHYDGGEDIAHDAAECRDRANNVVGRGLVEFVDLVHVRRELSAMSFSFQSVLL